MTTNHHTVIGTGAAANASVFNAPLSQLDTAITTNATNVAATTAEVVAARDAYPSLDSRLDALVMAGGNVATKANGASVAGQKVLTVDSTTGFIVGAYVTYLLNNTTLEGNTIASIQAGVSLTMGANIGTGGVLDDSYISMISISEYQAAQAIPHAGTLMLPQTMEYANGGVYNVTAYGASSGASAAVNTAAIVATITAVPVTGGEVKIPASVYSVDDTLDMKSLLTLRGVFGGILDGDSASSNGSLLRYEGAINKPIVSMKNVEYVVCEGIGVDGTTIAGCTGFLIDSTNSPQTRWVYLRRVSAMRLSSGVGIQIGTSGLTGYQTDNITVSDFAIHSTTTGIKVDSINASTVVIERGTIWNANRGIHLGECGFLRISDVTFGGSTGVDPAFIDITSNHGNISIENCQGEGGSGLQLRVASTAADDDIHPIRLVGNTFNLGVDIQKRSRILSLGNYYTEDFVLSGDNIAVVSVNDRFAPGKGFVKTGTGCQVLSLTPGTASPYLEIVSNVEGNVLKLTATDGRSVNPSLMLSNPGSGGGSWLFVFPGAGGLQPGGLVFRNSGASTNPFQIESSAPDQSLTLSNNGVQLGGAVLMLTGAGSPEGNNVAPVGSLYLRTGGGAGSTLYVKESGSSNTGWAAK